MIRAFIAIETPPPVKEFLAALQHLFRPLFARSNVTWVQPSNIHLTLKFLGDVPPSQIDAIETACHFIHDFPVFEMTLSELGFFPHLKNPKVFWCGYAPSDLLNSLQNQLEEKLSAIGFPKEDRDFTPHLTLARIKSFDSHARTKLISALENCTQKASHSVEEVILFQSQLTPKGSIYTPLKKFTLKKN